MKILISFIFSAIIVLSSCNTEAQTDKTSKKSNTKKEEADSQKSTVAKDIKLSEFDELMAEIKPVLVDVRTAQEFAQGHIDGAINVDVMTPEFIEEMENLQSKDQPVMLYCRSGGRSARAMSMLKKEGYVEMYNLLGGFNGYTKR